MPPRSKRADAGSSESTSLSSMPSLNTQVLGTLNTLLERKHRPSTAPVTAVSQSADEDNEQYHRNAGDYDALIHAQMDDGDDDGNQHDDELWETDDADAVNADSQQQVDEESKYDDDSTNAQSLLSPFPASSASIEIELPRDAITALRAQSKRSDSDEEKTKKKTQPLRLTPQQKLLVTRIHKAHVMCVLVLIKRYSQLGDSAELRALMLSIVPSNLTLAPSTFKLTDIRPLLNWWHNRQSLLADTSPTTPMISKCCIGNWRRWFLCLSAQCKAAIQYRRGNAMSKVLLFVSLLRAMGVRTRLVYGCPIENYQQLILIQLLKRQSNANTDRAKDSKKGKSRQPAPPLVPLAQQRAKALNVLRVFWKNARNDDPCPCQLTQSLVQWSGVRSSHSAEKNAGDPSSATQPSTKSQRARRLRQSSSIDADCGHDRKSTASIVSSASFGDSEVIELSSDEDSDIEQAKQMRLESNEHDSSPLAHTLTADDSDFEDVPEPPAKRAKREKSVTAKPQRTANRVSEEDGEEEEEEGGEKSLCAGCNLATADDSEPVLLCDGCEAEWHLRCINPRLKTVPRGRWFCVDCQNVNKTDRGAKRSKKVKTERSEAETAGSDSVEKSSDRRRSKRARTVKTKVINTTEESKSSLSPAVNRRAEKSPPKSSRSSSQWIQCWCEVYCPIVGRWCHVDPINCLIDAPYEYEGAIKPKRIFSYVFAAHPSPELRRRASSSATDNDNDNDDDSDSVPVVDPIIDDVTPRYSVGVAGSVPRNRLEQPFLSSTLAFLSSPLSADDRKLRDTEQQHLALTLANNNKELPTTLAALKKHPLYVTKDSEKKYEMLRPGARVVKQVTINSKVYQLYHRTDLSLLHTTERWIRERRQVKESELSRPAKTVQSNTMMSRKKRKLQERMMAMCGHSDFEPLSLDNRVNEELKESAIDDEDQSRLYGIWQTEDWSVGAAIDGVVPKNARGHVDLWTDAHLPRGCSHLAYPRIAPIARKLGIDYADAMVGFDIRGGRSIPSFNGIVVASENSQLVLTEYWEREKELRERAETKRIETITFHWRKLVRATIVKAKVIQQLRDKHGDDASEAVSDRLSNKTKSAKSVVPKGESAASVVNDLSHVHAFTETVMDPTTGAWHSACKCGAKVDGQSEEL